MARCLVLAHGKEKGSKEEKAHQKEESAKTRRESDRV
jgi:hypothetical protein